MIAHSNIEPLILNVTMEIARASEQKLYSPLHDVAKLFHRPIDPQPIAHDRNAAWFSTVIVETITYTKAPASWAIIGTVDPVARPALYRRRLTAELQQLSDHQVHRHRPFTRLPIVSGLRRVGDRFARLLIAKIRASDLGHWMLSRWFACWVQ